VGYGKRITTIFQAKSNAALNKMEDPARRLDLSYDKQLENLTKGQARRRRRRDRAQARRRFKPSN